MTNLECRENLPQPKTTVQQIKSTIHTKKKVSIPNSKYAGIVSLTKPFRMKRTYRKTDMPVGEIRRLLEPGPIVLVSSRWQNRNNIMTMGWHCVLEFSPSLIGCMITASNHSFDMIGKSGECVINIPTADMIDTIVGIGNTTGRRINKFRKFNLTPGESQHISAPRIEECYAHFECRVADRKMLAKYNFFILEVLSAQAAVWPRFPRTVHYRGNGEFMESGRNIAMPGKFRPENL